MNDPVNNRSPKTWAIGGGKGGVGKSVIAANIAVALAESGQRVVILDADLGGANAHTLFGMAGPKLGLSDVFAKRVDHLDAVRVETPVDGLSLISGARALLEMANPKFAQKTKILRQVMALDADHVILDIGAGSAFNILDFFLSAHRGILVVVPEPTSIENAYHFLRAAFYRFLKHTEPREVVREVVQSVSSDLENRGIRSPKDLIDAVGRESSQAGDALRRQAQKFKPGVIVNRVRTPDQKRLGEQIGLACRDYFGTDIEVLGSIDEDLLVSQSVLQRRPILKSFPASPFGRGIRSIVDRLGQLEGF